MPAQEVALGDITGIAADANGGVVVCEWPANVIQRIRFDGIIETIAGTGEIGYSGDGGPAVNAAIGYPVTPRFDGRGNLYFGDSFNARIRRIDPNGVITTVVGDGIFPATGMDLEGPSLQRSVWGGNEIAVSQAGTLYFTQGPFVLRLNADGNIQKIAGVEHDFCGSCWRGDGGPALEAELAGPGALAVDGAGDVYVTDGGRRIRKISPDGVIAAFAGYGSTDALTPDGTAALNAGFAGVVDLAADAAGNVYLVQVSGANVNLVRRIDTTGILGTVASGPGGILAASPQFLAMQGGQVVAYASLTLVMRITSAGETVLAGGGSPKAAPDGTPARSAWFLHPSAMSVNRAGDRYVAEQDVCLIRKIGADGILKTVGGTGICGVAAYQKPSTTQDLAPPAKILADSRGNVYTVDMYGNGYTITPDGKVALNSLPSPQELAAIDAKDRIYIQNGGLIRIWPDGRQETVLNLKALPPGVVNLTCLNGFGVDPAGNVYFSGWIVPPDHSPSHDQVFRVNDDATVTPVSSLLRSQSSVSLAIDLGGDVWRAAFPQIAEVSGANEWSVGRAASSFSDRDYGYSGDRGAAQSARFNISMATTAPNGDFYLLEGNRVRKLTGMAAPSPPQITAGGIVNALSYIGGAIAAGELVAILGSNFGVSGIQTYQPENNHVPLVLGRVKVLFNDFPGAITAVTPNQINVFVPYTAVPQQQGNTVLPGSTVTVAVQVDGAGSSQTLPLANAAPGIASADMSGGGQGAILNQDGTTNSSANAASPGSIVSLFGTGEGWTSPQLTVGDFSIATPYQTPLQKVTVTIGGQPALVTYAGAAPFLPCGIWQINARIPAAAGTGSAVVAVSIGGIGTGQQVTLAVK